MVDDAVENGLGPGGRSAKLFQHHRRHAAIQRLEVVAIPLSIRPALNHLFSEKFPVDSEVWADRMYLDIRPELGALRLNDVNVSPVDGSNTARGRLAILLNLVRDEHSLLSSGSQAGLPGKFRNQIPDPVVSAGVESLGAACSMPAVWVQDVLTSFPPRGGPSTLLSRARGRETQALVHS